MHYFWLLTLSSTIKKKFQVLSELHNLNLKLFSNQYNKYLFLYLIVMPQLSSNYSAKTRQAGQGQWAVYVFSYVYDPIPTKNFC